MDKQVKSSVLQKMEAFYDWWQNTVKGNNLTDEQFMNAMHRLCQDI